MNPIQRGMAFGRAIRNMLDEPSAWHVAESFGFSNRARFIDGGMLVGVVNLEGFLRIDHNQFNGMVILGVIDASPEDHVYFAVTLGKQSVLALHDELRRHEIRVNNVRLYLLESGKLYVSLRGYHDSLRAEHGFEPAPDAKLLDVQQITFALYPPASTAHRSLMAGQFIAYIAEMVGRDKIHEVQPWGTQTTALSPEMRRMPAAIALQDLQQHIRELGGHYPLSLTERFHLALNYLPHKHFVILSGLSGTGKTSLAIRYGLAVHGFASSEAESPLTFICPVRPDWTDSTGLLGYYDVISDRYVVPKFLEAVIAALTHKDSPVFVILDEMNNARVEYYLADVLSAMESRAPIYLHAHATALRGTAGGEIPGSVPLPPNLFLVGTINVDETTQAISDKVLDRAVVIDMSDVDIAGYYDQLSERSPELRPAVEASASLLVALSEILNRYGFGFGYRAAEEVIRYVQAAAKLGTSRPEVVLDAQIAQKLLVKLRGDEQQRDLLDRLRVALDAMPRSSALIGRLNEELDDFGSFQSLR